MGPMGPCGPINPVGLPTHAPEELMTDVVPTVRPFFIIKLTLFAI
jgi:hypothetical protein